MTTSTISSSTWFSENILLKKALLICGILSSLYYVAINIFVPTQFPGYSLVSQTESELSAIGAPTRQLWVLLAMVYILLFAAFGWGVLNSAGRNRLLHNTGVAIVVYCAINFFWPPMHLRGNERTLTDNLHIVWAIVTLLNMMLIMGFGAAALGRSFRLYTIATWVVFIVFGTLTGIDGPRIAADLPTPWIGVWERINIGTFMLWVVVLAIALLRKKVLN